MSVEPWIAGLIIWLLVQPLFLRRRNRFRGTIRKYQTGTLSRLLIPFSSRWESRVQAEDLAELRRYRRFIMFWYYVVFVLPLARFHISLLFIAIRLHAHSLLSGR